MGNILTADYAGEQTETNTYNELGLLTTVTTAEGDTLYQYDDASRLLSVTQPSGETVSYTYDSHGNRSSMTYPNGKTVSYSYDEMNRLIAVKGVDGETTKYSYDVLGRRIATDGVKEDTVYAYDEVGNLVSQTTTGAYDLALEYAYDLSGRMTQESRTENGATLTSVFAYDPLGQLTSFTRSDGQSESYAYDPVGNMTAKTQNGVSTAMRYNAANQLISSVTGNDTTKYTYDANGNLTRSENAGGARSYAYNALNLLQSFTREDGYSETYTYNANRLLSEIRTSEDLTTTLTWDILYGDGVVISADQNGKSTNYTYGLERISAISGSTRTEYVYDGRGSVAAEVSYNNAWYTFGGGLARKNVVSKSYSPFGELLTEQTSGFGYNGEYYNAATGMIYLRARFYEPEMNRFGQKDTLRGSIIDGISLNRYLYCQSDPVNFADYNGLQMVNVCVADGGGGGSFRNSRTYKSFLAEGQRLANEAKQNMRQAELAWHQAEAYAPGSQVANAAMNAWKHAKSAAARALTNLSKLQSAGSLCAATTYIANIRSAANTARNAANEARICADRAAGNRANSAMYDRRNEKAQETAVRYYCDSICDTSENEIKLYIALGSVTFSLSSGWEYRIDPANPGTRTKRHIHIIHKGKEYIQNDDGSPHDKKRGGSGRIPDWVNELLKEQANWDYNGKREDFFKLTEVVITDSDTQYYFADGTTVVLSNMSNYFPYYAEESFYARIYATGTNDEDVLIDGTVFVPFIPAGSLPELPFIPSIPFPAFA